MSEDFTQKLPKNGHDSEILTAIKNLDMHIVKIDDRLQGLEQKFDGLETKVDGIEKKVDARLHDTRPIWHKVVADIAELQSGQKRLEEGQKDMREAISELSSNVHDVNRDQIVINDSLRRIQLDFVTVNERLFKLARDRNQQNSST